MEQYGMSYFDHTAERFRSLEVVACSFKQGACDVASDPQLSIRIGLKGVVYPVDTVTCILNFEMLALK